MLLLHETAVGSSRETECLLNSSKGGGIYFTLRLKYRDGPCTSNISFREVLIFLNVRTGRNQFRGELKHRFTSDLVSIEEFV